MSTLKPGQRVRVDSDMATWLAHNTVGTVKRVDETRHSDNTVQVLFEKPIVLGGRPQHKPVWLPEALLERV